MSAIKALIIAFSTYSKIPMPKIDWEEKNMKYAVCFFPMIGIVIGLLWYGWLYFADNIRPVDATLRNAIAVLIPIVITGGIHLDGFCDITDAFSSWQPKEKKLEILKDPHVGAFAIIGCCCYFLAYYGIMGEIDIHLALFCSFGFVLSRALSSLALIHFKSARPKGMLDTFAKSSHKKIVTLSALAYIIVCLAIMIWLDITQCVFVVFACVLCFLIYRILAYKKLGGTTGDMAGWFLQVCELAIPYSLFIFNMIIN